MQRPDASHIAGYTAWQKNFKRQVIKGEKGIKIIAPTPYRVKKEIERIDPASGSVIPRDDGTPEMVESYIEIQTFRIATVFDISQTEGEPLPQIGVDEMTGHVDSFSDFFSALEKSSPVPIIFCDITGGAKGYYKQTDKHIGVKSGMSEIQILKTAVHEIAHARLHDIDKNEQDGTERPSRQTREVEAESIAYTVCQHYGIDTSEYSFGYIAGWSSGKELDTLKKSLEVIRSESGSIIREIDEHRKELTKARCAEREKSAEPDYERVRER
jgi:antirestriction protein ArdC